MLGTWLELGAMERGVMTVVVVVGDEVFCLSETKNCEVLEARREEGPKQNTHTHYH